MSVPAPWSFSKGGPVRIPALFVYASTVIVEAAGVEMLKGSGAPVLSNVEFETVKLPDGCRNRR